MQSPAIEVIVMSAITSETKKSGQIRKVTFLLANDGEHPFAGMVGDRLHIVPVHINDDETPGEVRSGHGEAHAPKGAAASPSSFREKPASVQAGMRCSDRRFWNFLGEKYHCVVEGAGFAADLVREYCCVKSRRHLDDEANHKSRVLWHQLDTEFMQWAGLIAEAR